MQKNRSFGIWPTLLKILALLVQHWKTNYLKSFTKILCVWAFCLYILSVHRLCACGGLGNPGLGLWWLAAMWVLGIQCGFSGSAVSAHCGTLSLARKASSLISS